MKHVRLIPIIAVAMLASLALATAQGSNTEPQDRGNTGWTGGGHDQPAQQNGGNDSGTTDPAAQAAQAAAQAAQAAAQAARDTEAAKSQPLMAEGLSLTGEPRRFAPRNTVE